MAYDEKRGKVAKILKDYRVLFYLLIIKKNLPNQSSQKIEHIHLSD
jgi:hypothetical protein